MKIENWNLKIRITQKQNKLCVEFTEGKMKDEYQIARAEDFLVAVDSFIKRRKIDLASLRKANLKFSAQGGPASGWEKPGLLTERVVRAIVKGLSFS